MYNKFTILASFFFIFLVNIAEAQYTVILREPIGSASVVSGSGYEIIAQYIHHIYVYLASIVGLVAVLYIVFSGIQIVLGGIKSDMVQKAQARILNSILSLAMLFGSALLLKTINASFFG